MWRRVPPLTVYNAYFFMALSFGFTAWGLNLALLYVPLCNGEESSLAEYAQDHRGRIVSVAAGLACGVGMAFQFLGGLAGGCAAAALKKSLVLSVLGIACFVGSILLGSGESNKGLDFGSLNMQLVCRRHLASWQELAS